MAKSPWDANLRIILMGKHNPFSIFTLVPYNLPPLPLKTVVLNFVGGTEPLKFHTCIHQTLRSWKNEM